MSKYARILKIENGQILVGLLNDKGLCGSGTCEGCSCSKKLQTMSIKRTENTANSEHLNTGMDVEMISPDGTALDWFILIFMPVLLTAGTALFLKNQSEIVRNMTALATGILSFSLSALILKFLRKDQTIKLIPVKKMDHQE